MASGVFTPYSTISAFAGTAPAGIPSSEVERIQAYATYEQIYWTSPDTFALVSRGTENKPIYLPSGRVIVETMNRYLAPGFSFNVGGDAPDAEKAAAQLSLGSLWAREAMTSKFAAAKRFGLIRGDWLFHVRANPLKTQGSRISIDTIDPATYFPVRDSDLDPDLITRVHIADHYLDSDGKTTLVRRLTYDRITEGSSQITSMVDYWTLQEFAKEDGKPFREDPPVLLDPRITAFPVYHIRNFVEPGNPWGSSEMRGIEMLMAGMNQTISDEDLALALEGLGLYATDGGGPVDENGNDTDWILGPGRVVDNAQNFRRVSGVSSVSATQDHIKMLWDFAQMATGVNSAAIGDVDVQVAESGIALALRLGPILDHATEKQSVVADVMNQMLYDLKSWFQVYEQASFLLPEITASFRNPLPNNLSGDVDVAVKMVTSVPPIMSATSAREWLATKGIIFAPDEFARIMQEAQAAADVAASSDPLGARMAAEAGTPSTGATGA